MRRAAPHAPNHREGCTLSLRSTRARVSASAGEHSSNGDELSAAWETPSDNRLVFSLRRSILMQRQQRFGFILVVVVAAMGLSLITAAAVAAAAADDQAKREPGGAVT